MTRAMSPRSPGRRCSNMWIGLALVANGRARHGEIVQRLGRPARHRVAGRNLRSDAFRQGEQETPCLDCKPNLPRGDVPRVSPLAMSPCRAASAPTRARPASTLQRAPSAVDRHGHRAQGKGQGGGRGAWRLNGALRNGPGRTSISWWPRAGAKARSIAS